MTTIYDRASQREQAILNGAPERYHGELEDAALIQDGPHVAEVLGPRFMRG